MNQTGECRRTVDESIANRSRADPRPSTKWRSSNREGCLAEVIKLCGAISTRNLNALVDRITLQDIVSGL